MDGTFYSIVIPKLHNHVHGEHFFYFTLLMTNCRTLQVHSQSSRKVKPIKSPSTPPTSATRLPNEKASSSFRTRTLSLTNNGMRFEVFWINLFTFPTSWKIQLLAFNLLGKFCLNLIFHEGTWHETFCLHEEFTSRHFPSLKAYRTVFIQCFAVVTKW